MIPLVVLVLSPWLATQEGDPPPAPGDPPPAPESLRPLEPPTPLAPESPPESTPTSRPAQPAPLVDAPVPRKAGETNVVASAGVGAFGAALGAAVGAGPALFVLFAAPEPARGEAIFGLLALAALPSVAALGAGMLAVVFVIDHPGWNDAADVLLCSAISCLLPVLVAAAVGGGGSCGGGSCGSGNCGSGGGGNETFESPALAHALGAAIGGFVGASVGTVLIAVELDEPTAPQARAGALQTAVLVGAGAGVLGAVIGGGIGGVIGAEIEDDRRVAKGL